MTPTPAPRRPAGDTLPTTLLTALLILVWLAATAWARPLMLPDEGRYVGVAWEMMRSHDWLTPTLNGLPYFHKPPLFYWITAGSLSLFGMNEWAARAAPILGAWLAIFSFYLFTRRHAGPQAARLTLIALLAQPLLFLGGQYANLDMLVAGCITATVAALADAALSIEQSKPYRRSLWGGYALAALGVLAKGLIGFVIPGLVLTVWLLLRGRWRTFLRLLSLPGALVFLVVVGPWFAAMQQRFSDFLYYFIVVQHFKRFAETGFNNVQPFWFYPALLLLASLFWWPWLRRVASIRYLADLQLRPVRLLMLCWLAMPVLFFTMPQSKLVGYVLPAVPPLVFLMADGYLLGARSTGTRVPRTWWIAAALAMALNLAVVGWLTVHLRHSSRDIARTIGTQNQLQGGPARPVVMLRQYYFDLPFYAHTRVPAAVVEDWSSPEVAKQDNWRKEVFDAGKFDPALAQQVLIEPPALSAYLCKSAAGVGSWVVGADDSTREFPFLAQAQVLTKQQGLTLWRVEATQVPGCTPPNATPAN